ncbi:MAG TPA: hypothetical protein VMP01_05055 [Pirellulaceae bacterium]|nr:hypothetical protein [Pirellulaceae bacterium]
MPTSNGVRPSRGGKPHGSSQSLAWARRNCRTLRVEALESRYLLSTMAAFDGDPCPLEPLDAAAEEPVAAGEPSVDTLADGDDGFVGPLELDAYYASLDTAQADAATIQAEGESVGASPVLEKLTGIFDSGYWILSGYVTDDVDPVAGKVYFGEDLEGAFTDLMPDGSFSHYTAMPPGTSGTVSAVAKDADGNLSNTLTVDILA